MKKIIAIGDFHGKFPEKLIRIIKKENPDLIVSTGDFCGNDLLRKLFFKYVYGQDTSLEEAIGKRKAYELEKNNFLSGIKVLKILNSFNIPVMGVNGNWDYGSFKDIGYPKDKSPFIERFDYVVKTLKNIHLIDFKRFLVQGTNFIGYPASTYPGFADKHITKKKIKEYGEDEAKKLFMKIDQDNKKYFLKISSKFSNNLENIFISHNCLYRTKLDIIKKGEQKGNHYGSYLAKKITKELSPRIVICGHIHENQGKQLIGKTLVINPGAARDNKLAILNIEDNNISVRFVR